eukprot:6335563-Pyramimonas_sp.AAC.1
MTEPEIQTLRTSIANSMASLVSSIAQPLNAVTANELFGAVSRTTFSADQKRMLSHVIQQKLLASNVTQRLAPTDKQHFRKTGCILSYFTSADWEILSNQDLPYDSDVKAMVVTKRLVAGGMTQPSSKACAEVVALLAAS